MRKRVSREVQKMQKKITDFPMPYLRERARAGMVWGIVR
jgi:hypothetical protein